MADEKGSGLSFEEFKKLHEAAKIPKKIEEHLDKEAEEALKNDEIDNPDFLDEVNLDKFRKEPGEPAKPGDIAHPNKKELQAAKEFDDEVKANEVRKYIGIPFKKKKPAQKEIGRYTE